MSSAGGDDAWIKEMLARAVLDDTDPANPGPDDTDPATGDAGADRNVGHGVVDPVVVDALPVEDRPTEALPRIAPVGKLRFDASDDPGLDDGRFAGADDPTLVQPVVEAMVDGGDGGDGADGGGDDGWGGDDGPEGDPESNVARGIIEWVVVLVGAVAVALILRAFLFQAFWIPTESMEDTLVRSDRVLVNKLSYDLHDVNRGDVIVFRRPDEEEAEIRDLIKRVIALPGETIEGRDNAIYIDGGRLSEPYLDPDEFIDDFGPVTVPEGEVFVMGDNRDQSYDSRFFGTVSEDRIIGRAFLLFWPLNRIGTL